MNTVYKALTTAALMGLFLGVTLRLLGEELAIVWLSVLGCIFLGIAGVAFIIFTLTAIWKG